MILPARITQIDNMNKQDKKHTAFITISFDDTDELGKAFAKVLKEVIDVAAESGEFTADENGIDGDWFVKVNDLNYDHDTTIMEKMDGIEKMASDLQMFMDSPLDIIRPIKSPFYKFRNDNSNH